MNKETTAKCPLLADAPTTPKSGDTCPFLPERLLSRPSEPEPPLHTEREAAVFLRSSLSKLRRMRKDGSGPVYVKLGHNFMYRRSDLDAFLQANSSTENE